MQGKIIFLKSSYKSLFHNFINLVSFAQLIAFNHLTHFKWKKINFWHRAKGQYCHADICRPLPHCVISLFFYSIMCKFHNSMKWVAVLYENYNYFGRPKIPIGSILFKSFEFKQYFEFWTEWVNTYIKIMNFIW